MKPGSDLNSTLYLIENLSFVKCFHILHYYLTELFSQLFSFLRKEINSESIYIKVSELGVKGLLLEAQSYLFYIPFHFSMIKNLNQFPRGILKAWHHKCPGIAFFTKAPDMFLMSSHKKQLDYMIFYFRLVCFTFLFHIQCFHFIIYLFQFPPLFLFLFFSSLN